MRTWLLLGSAVLIVVAAVVWQGEVQRDAASANARRLVLAQQVHNASVDAETGVGGYIVSHQSDALAIATRARTDLTRSMQRARADAAGDAVVSAAVGNQAAAIAAWWKTADAQISAVRGGNPTIDVTRAALERDAAMQTLRAATLTYQGSVERAQRESLDDAARGALIAIFAAGGAFLLLGYFLVVRSRRRVARRAAHDAHYVEHMLFAVSEADAIAHLSDHLTEVLPGASVLVLTGSDERLERCQATPAGVPLRSPQPGSASPCDVCSKLAPARLCVPLRAGGDAVGAVAVGSKRASDLDEQLVTHASGYAAPVLANLRNLAVAQARAATDALTGLPNRRAVDTVLPLLLAHAHRTNEPLAAVMLDIDHFKGVNDRWGHERGDDVLTLVAGVLRATLRSSDFVGRSGGEEFLVLLPRTDSVQAGLVAEKVRGAVAAARFAALDVRVTASLGIAVFPEHATNAAELLRAADAAMYRAKELGRNRVVRVTTSAWSAPPATSDTTELTEAARR